MKHVGAQNFEEAQRAEFYDKFAVGAQQEAESESDNTAGR